MWEKTEETNMEKWELQVQKVGMLAKLGRGNVHTTKVVHIELKWQYGIGQ